MTQWNDVSGHEGYYQVNVNGEIRRHPNNLGSCNTKYRDGYILKQKDNGKGYLRVKLTIGNKTKMVMVHRIIAEAFIPNTNNKPYVNHKNGIKTDNRVENLEWCTQSENVKHAHDTGLKKHIPRGYKVMCTKTGVVYKSIADCARELKIDRSYLAEKLMGKYRNNTTIIKISDRLEKCI